MRLLEDKGRDYRRLRPSANEKQQLAANGFQWVLSSFITGIGTVDDNLIIRFKNGSIYTYTNIAKLFRPMLQSNSKGKYFWKNIRRKNIPYARTGKLPLKSDIEVSDEELFEDLDDDIFNKITANLPDTMKSEKVTFIDPITGLAMWQYKIGDFVIFTVLK